MYISIKGLVTSIQIQALVKIGASTHLGALVHLEFWSNWRLQSHSVFEQGGGLFLIGNHKFIKTKHKAAIQVKRYT
jgi:hypothetical protein